MSVFGYITGSDDAAAAKAAAYNQANAFGQTALGNANAAWSPFSSAGTQGMESLSALMQGGGNVSGRLDAGNYAQGTDPGTFSGVGDLTQDAGYRARMDAAQAGLNENQFLDGTYGSGAAAKEMASFMQELGSNETKNAYDRALSTYETKNNDFNNDRNFGYQQYLTDLGTMTGDVNRQQGLATTMLGAGQNAATAQSGNWMNWGQQAGNNAIGVGNSQAEGAVAGSPWSMLSGLTNLGTKGYMASQGMA